MCSGPWAGADCSASARALTAVPATVSVADALSLNRVSVATLTPGRSQYFYLYVPPVLQRTVPSADSAEYTEDGLVISTVRLSDGGDADYFLLAPPSVTTDPTNSGRARIRVSALASAQHAVASGGWPSESYFSYSNAQCDNCFDDLLADAVESVEIGRAHV